MDTNNKVLSAAIGSLFILGLASGNVAAASKKVVAMEDCYGIAKAGKNDCANKKTTHSCAGKAKKDGDPLDFVAVPQGTCAKIAKGFTKPVELKKPTRKL